jgi:hypothetical protein
VSTKIRTRHAQFLPAQNCAPAQEVRKDLWISLFRSLAVKGHVQIKKSAKKCAILLRLTCKAQTAYSPCGGSKPAIPEMHRKENNRTIQHYPLWLLLKSGIIQPLIH